VIHQFNDIIFISGCIPYVVDEKKSSDHFKRYCQEFLPSTEVVPYNKDSTEKFVVVLYLPESRKDITESQRNVINSTPGKNFIDIVCKSTILYCLNL
jgi:hypothetical protein